MSIEQVAKKLTAPQKRALLWLTDEPKAWPDRRETPLYGLEKWTSGNALKGVVLHCCMAKYGGRTAAEKGAVWGKALWVITPVGQAVKDYLEANP